MDTATAMDYRPVTEQDIEACADVFYAADDELMERAGLPPTQRNRPNLVRLFAHITATDPDRVWLAQQDDRVVAFSMAVQRDGLTFLAFLFVEPGLQARGIGRALLERAMAGSKRTGVCIFSAQPVSAALYAKYGMVPRVPMYTLTGKLKEAMPPLPAGLRVEPLDVAGTEALDVEVTGFSRPQDHAAWEAWGRLRHGLFKGPALLGYGYVQSSGRLGPFVVREQENLLPFVGELTRRVQAIEDWMINVPGPAEETFVELLRQGFRLDGPPIIYCASGSETDHSRYLPSTFALP
jgi:GNAT superfamily N-acetyltransferase